MKKSDILAKALELLGPNGENWIKFATAANEAKCVLFYPTYGAVYFDIKGAILRADNPYLSNSFEVDKILIYLNDVVQTARYRHLVHFNDHKNTKFKDVQNLYRIAIYHFKKEERKEEAANSSNSL